MNANTIENFMTTTPHTISVDQNLQYATDMMKEYDIRHLPVLDGGKLVGVLSERDIRFVESFDSLNPKEILVEDAYTDDPLTLEYETDIAIACNKMLDHKIGSLLITKNSKLIGIFTWIDALKIIASKSKGLS